MASGMFVEKGHSFASAVSGGSLDFPEVGWPGLGGYYGLLAEKDHLFHQPVLFLGGPAVDRVVVDPSSTSSARAKSTGFYDNADTLTYVGHATWRDEVRAALLARKPSFLVWDGIEWEMHNEAPRAAAGRALSRVALSDEVLVWWAKPDKPPGPGTLAEVRVAQQAGARVTLLLEGDMIPLAEQYLRHRDRLTHPIFPYMHTVIPTARWVVGLDRLTKEIGRKNRKVQQGTEPSLPLSVSALIALYTSYAQHDERYKGELDFLHDLSRGLHTNGRKRK